MAVRSPGRVPSRLLGGAMRVLRPADAAGVYSNPRAEFARLERRGALHKVAPGYYAVVPDDLVGRSWLPELEAVALGIVVAGGNIDDAALMGVSAARYHGSIPRALGSAVVATRRHRRPTVQLVDRDAEVIFVRRDVAQLDLQRVRTELGDGWTTSIEQTVLDLAARPGLGGVQNESETAVQALLSRADLALLGELAERQRKATVLRRLLGSTHAQSK